MYNETICLYELDGVAVLGGRVWGNREKEREGGGEKAPSPTSLSLFFPDFLNPFMHLLRRLGIDG